jgi:hypothetical protein
VSRALSRRTSTSQTSSLTGVGLDSARKSSDSGLVRLRHLGVEGRPPPVRRGLARARHAADRWRPNGRRATVFRDPRPRPGEIAVLQIRELEPGRQRTESGSSTYRGSWSELNVELASTSLGSAPRTERVAVPPKSDSSALRSEQIESPLPSEIKHRRCDRSQLQPTIGRLHFCTPAQMGLPFARKMSRMAHDGNSLSGRS